MNTQQKTHGETFSEQDSRIEKHKSVLKSQIRESFGRVAYSHKTHEKCADILLKRNSVLKLMQLILSGVTTGSFVVTILGDGLISSVTGAIFSTLLLVLTSYLKDIELASIAEKHSTSALQLWEIREDYLSLLTDFDYISIDEIIGKREELQKRLSSVYSGSPRTNFKAYKKAQSALKVQEELTFSDSEIDVMLPKELRKLSKDND